MRTIYLRAIMLGVVVAACRINVVAMLRPPPSTATRFSADELVDDVIGVLITGVVRILSVAERPLDAL
jgi:hypothetical protein